MHSCNKCGQEKSDEDFYRDSTRSRGVYYNCKSCIHAYYKSNLEKKKAYDKARRQEKWDLMSSQRKAYYRDNREKVTIKQKEYYEAHKMQIIQYNSRYIKERKKIDPLFKFERRVRQMLNHSIRKHGWTKRSRTQEIIGCTFLDLQAHLISTALDTYGYWTEHTIYHIDHIIPLATACSEGDIAKLNHFTNLQYLTPQDNMAKGAKLDWMQEKYSVI